MFNKEGSKSLKIICCSLLVSLALVLSVLPSFASSPSLNWGKQYPNQFQSYAMTIQDSDTVKYFTFNHGNQASDDVIVVVQSVPTPVPFYVTIMPFPDQGWALYGNCYEEGILDFSVTISVFSLTTGSLLSEEEATLGRPTAVIINNTALPVDYYTRVACYGSTCEVWGAYSTYIPYQGYDYTKWLNALYVYSITENEYLRLILDELEKLNGVEPSPEQTTRDTSSEEGILEDEKNYRFNDEDMSVFDVNPFEDLDGNGVLFIQDLFEEILLPITPVLLVSLLGGLVVFALGRKVK